MMYFWDGVIFGMILMVVLFFLCCVIMWLWDFYILIRNSHFEAIAHNEIIKHIANLNMRKKK